MPKTKKTTIRKKCDYFITLWQTRKDLELKGIKQILNAMRKGRVIDSITKNDHNLVSGRYRNDEFLDKLLIFDESVTKAHFFRQVYNKDAKHQLILSLEPIKNPREIRKINIAIRLIENGVV